jgi:alkaline phosphatase
VLKLIRILIRRDQNIPFVFYSAIAAIFAWAVASAAGYYFIFTSHTTLPMTETAKNVIIMIGDGMGWEMARAAAIYQQIQEGKTGTTLNDFYTAGKGEGLNYQTLANYSLVTTYGTTIADSKGLYTNLK